MDSILEMDSQEIQAVKQALMADHKALFREHAESLFYDCFLMITSTGAKTENFQLLRSLSESDEALSLLFETVLNLCAQVFRMSVKGADEF
jgi:hypothetical protein